MRTEIPSWPEALFGDGDVDDDDDDNGDDGNDNDNDDDGRRFSEIDINVVTSTCLSKPMNRGRIVFNLDLSAKKF